MDGDFTEQMLRPPASDNPLAMPGDSHIKIKRPRVFDILDRLKQVHGEGFSEKHTQQSNDVLYAASAADQEDTSPTQTNDNNVDARDIEDPNLKGFLCNRNPSDTLRADCSTAKQACATDASTSATAPQPMAECHPFQLANGESILTAEHKEELAVVNETNKLPMDGQSACEALQFASSVLPLEARLASMGPKNEIVWKPHQESLEEFLSVASPSMVWSPCQWIVVHNNNPDSLSNSPSPVASCNVTPIKKLLKDLEAKLHANQIVSITEKTSIAQRIMDIAQTQKFTLGKWLIRFSPSDRLDEFWKRLAEHTANGNLGCCIKMAPAKYLRQDAFEKVLCSVYVKDFTDIAEVKRVWWALRKLGFCQFGVTGFKPEIFSLCGISSGNSWRLKTVLYTFEDALSWDDDEKLADDEALRVPIQSTFHNPVA